jgi:alpha-tubulin suppressor-like RCC1 family protein
MVLTSCWSSDGAKDEATTFRGELVGGHVALESDYPATVQIAAHDKTCTATKLGPHHFLTAGHCVTIGTTGVPWPAGTTGTLSADNLGANRRDLTVVQNRLGPSYPLAADPSAPDIAVLEVAESSPDIPVAVVDVTPLVPGNAVVKCGYGCDEQPTWTGLRAHPVLIPPQDFIHPPASAAMMAALLPSYAVTKRISADPTSASLCFGDSGGPLYRDLPSELLVVGVNSSIGTNFDAHTRVDTQSYYGVAGWLASTGVRWRGAVAATPYLGVPSLATIPVEIENYDGGDEAAAYHDLTPGNQGGFYRPDGVDVQAAGPASNGAFVHASEGEWLRFSVSVPTGGDYSLAIRAAGSPTSGEALRLEIDNQDASGPISAPSISPSQWTNLIIPRVSLTPGLNLLRLLISAPIDLDSLQFSLLPLPCEDGANGEGETDIDCGGDVCAACASGKVCQQDDDCVSAFCLAGTCSTSLRPAEVEAGSEFSCGVFEEAQGNRVRCWGRNDKAQLGVNSSGSIGDQPGELQTSLQPVVLTGPVIGLSVGMRHACAVVQGNTLQCWGNNELGQLGLGYTSSSALPSHVDFGGLKVLTVTVGNDFTCARVAPTVLSSTKQVKCWGANNYGQLGVGSSQRVGDQPNEMGSNLLAVDLPQSASSISAGAAHACAVLSNGDVRCWGAAGSGRLGYGFSVGLAYGDSASEQSPHPAAIGQTATAVSAGGEHTCARLVTGDTKCWGSNAYGQLGYGDTTSRGLATTNMGTNLPAVPLGEDVARIIARGNATCAVDALGALRCWGQERALLGQPALFGQGSLGDQAGELTGLLPISFDDAPISVVSFSVSGFSGCALLSNHAVKCWGSNSSGELGLGDTQARGDNGGEMGDALPHLLFP